MTVKVETLSSPDQDHQYEVRGTKYEIYEIRYTIVLPIELVARALSAPPGFLVCQSLSYNNAEFKLKHSAANEDVGFTSYRVAWAGWTLLIICYRWVESESNG
jgi:hypothetical protein